MIHWQHRAILAPILVAALAPFALSGCLGKPEIEDRWTRLDINDVAIESASASWGQPVVVHARGSITYRTIQTGAVAMELRHSPSVLYDQVALTPDSPRLDRLHDVSRVLAESQVLASETVPVTGFDHLIQDLDFELEAMLPANDGGSIFLIFYFGEEQEEEVAPGEIVTFVDPAEFEAEQILPDGFELVPEVP